MALLGWRYLMKLVTPTVELIQQESVEIEVVPEKVVCSSPYIVHLAVLTLYHRHQRKSWPVIRSACSFCPMCSSIRYS